MDEQKNHTLSFNILDKIRHNLCLFWKTGWAQRDQNYCADPPIRDLTKIIIVNSLAMYLHGVVGEYGVEMVGLSGSRWFLHIVSRARAHNTHTCFQGVRMWAWSLGVSHPRSLFHVHTIFQISYRCIQRAF